MREGGGGPVSGGCANTLNDFKPQHTPALPDFVCVAPGSDIGIVNLKDFNFLH